MANFSSANAGVVLTVPADRVWKGRVYLSAAMTNSTNAVTARMASISVSGAFADNFEDGDVVAAVGLACSAVQLTSLIGAQQGSSIVSGDVVIRTRGGSVTLVLNLPSGTTGVGYAVGEFLI